MSSAASGRGWMERARPLVRSGLGALRYRLTGHRMPLHVHWLLTRRCNALCGYCTLPLRRVPELDTGERRLLIDHLGRLGTAQVQLSGGEPLLVPALPELLDRLRAWQIQIALETNGVAYPRMADDLGPLDLLLLPLDGSASHHDRMREPGSFAASVRALEYARARGVPVQLQAVLSSTTLDDLPLLLDTARAYQAEITFQLLHAPHPLMGSTGHAFRPSCDALRALLAALLREKEAGAPIAMSEKMLRHLISWKDYGVKSEAGHHEDMHCMAGQLFCAIDADGTVYPCTLLAGQGSGQSFREVGLEAAFASLEESSCQSCTAVPQAEQSYLLNLNLPRMMEWARARPALGGPERP